MEMSNKNETVPNNVVDTIFLKDKKGESVIIEVYQNQDRWGGILMQKPLKNGGFIVMQISVTEMIEQLAKMNLEFVEAVSGKVGDGL